MLKNKGFFILVLAALTLWAAAATAATYRYDVINVPAEDRGVSCSEQARAYAATMGAEYGVDVQASICEYDDLLQSYKIRIVYEASEPLRKVSTYTQNAGYTSRGVYASQEECFANLRAEEHLFEQMTGLSPFFSFCSRERREPDQPWYAHVDGIGQPDLVPARITFQTDNPYGVSASELKYEITESLRSQGIEVIHFTLRSRPVFGEATIFFYGPEAQSRFSLFSAPTMTVPGLSTCQAQLADLIAQLQSQPRITVVTGYCSSRYSNPSSFDITLVYRGVGRLDSFQSSESFDTMDACFLMQDEIRSNMQRAYGDRFLGAACGLPRNSVDPQFRVVGFRSPQ